MKAYYYDDLPGDPRSPHLTATELPPTHLTALGVLHTFLPPSSGPSPPTSLTSIASQRNYANADTITISPSSFGSSYASKLATFFEEHMHEDEEIRYILDGSGYFDVREKADDKWIRIAVGPGDLLVLPAGVYHRFTVDEKNFIVARRLFKDEPKWTPLPRGEGTDGNEVRKTYVELRERGWEGETLGEGVST